eukprot:TRINITY_DN4774_c0_g1_i1.p1 TRINITY_DN4774_c0_g1~~TRINITY_DN4774_c0_g1_i1.p1  ORF type:complete len:600 (-),score=162.40 TRINITY_DN4774_c0_g1_i1:668-2467(-)
MAMADTYFDPVDLVREDLEQPIVETAIQTIKKLPLVAKAIGEAETRDKLIPFLMKYAGFDDKDVLDRVVSDEALGEIARVMGQFLPFVGGARHANILFSMLEDFAVAQETCVREAAVSSFEVLVPLVRAQDPKVVSSLCVPICIRLASDEMFSSKCSAAGIIPVVHANVRDESERANLRKVFLAVSRDEVPMVRKFAYEHIGDLAIDAGVVVIKTELLEALRTLLEETHENIRMVTVDVARKISSACKKDEDELKEIAFPLIDQVANDASWRVRKGFAKTIGDFAASLSPKEFAGQTLSPYYKELISDPETEVRLAAIRSMVSFAMNVDQVSFDSQIVSCFESILSDSAQSIKTLFSDVVMEVVPHVSKSTASKFVLPVILRLLESEVTDMRSNALEKLPVLAEAVGAEEFVSQFLPKLLVMCKDSKWRVRKLVLEHTTRFATSVGIETFETVFKPILFEALQDAVYGVREAATKQFPALVQAFGWEWASSGLLQEALNFKCARSQNYQFRMVPLLICFELASQAVDLPASYMFEVLVPVVVEYSKDPVPNVRIFTVKTLAALAKKAGAGSTIKNALMFLTQDTDTEVKLSAVRVLKMI